MYIHSAMYFASFTGADPACYNNKGVISGHPTSLAMVGGSRSALARGIWGHAIPRKILDFRPSEIVSGAIWNEVITIASTLGSETGPVSDAVKWRGMCAHFSQAIFWLHTQSDKGSGYMITR